MMEAACQYGKEIFRVEIDVESHLVKKNRRPIYRNKRTGRVFLGKSPQLNQAEDYLVLRLRSEKNRQRIAQPIKHDVRIVLLFTFAAYYTKKSQRSRHVPDLSNLVELPLDALQKSEIIENDSLVCSLDGSRRLPGIKNKLEIIIYEFIE